MTEYEYEGNRARVFERWRRRRVATQNTVTIMIKMSNDPTPAAVAAIIVVEIDEGGFEVTGVRVVKTGGADVGVSKEENNQIFFLFMRPNQVCIQTIFPGPCNEDFEIYLLGRCTRENQLLQNAEPRLGPELSEPPVPFHKDAHSFL